MKTYLTVFFMWSCCFIIPSIAGMYIWVDENGVKHYSNTPVNEGHTKTIEERPEAVTADEEEKPSRKRSKLHAEDNEDELDEAMEAVSKKVDEHFDKVKKDTLEDRILTLESSVADQKITIKHQKANVETARKELSSVRSQLYTDHQRHKRRVENYERRLENERHSLEKAEQKLDKYENELREKERELRAVNRGY